jgi:hypothetical protein
MATRRTATATPSEPATAKMPLTAVKTTVQRGMVFDVTNHHVTRPGHRCRGTTRRIVVKVTGSSVYMNMAGEQGVPQWPAFQWPKASQVEYDADTGTIRLYGLGAGQRPDELFLTLVPVRRAAPRPRELADADALDILAEYMSNPDWPQAMITDLAAVVRRTGRVVDDYPDRRRTWPET